MSFPPEGADARFVVQGHVDFLPGERAVGVGVEESDPELFGRGDDGGLCVAVTAPLDILHVAEEPDHQTRGDEEADQYGGADAAGRPGEKPGRPAVALLRGGNQPVMFPCVRWRSGGFPPGVRIR